jgi:hypothetical protein
MFEGYFQGTTIRSYRTWQRRHLGRFKALSHTALSERENRGDVWIYIPCATVGVLGVSPKGNKGDPPVCNVIGCLVL